MHSTKGNRFDLRLTEQDLQELMDEKQRFNRETLNLSEAKAKSWAQRTVDGFRLALDLPGIESK